MIDSGEGIVPVGKRTLAFLGIALVLLILMGGMAGWLLGRAATGQQAAVSSSRETLSVPTVEATEADKEPERPETEEEEFSEDEQKGSEPASEDEPVLPTRRTVPRIPDTLRSADHIRADEVDIYLISAREYALTKASSKPDCSLHDAVQELIAPSDEQRQRGFLAAIPEQAQLEILGLDGDILYMLVMLSRPEQLAFVNEALMYDALTLTTLGFAEIRHVQYVIDPSLGFQGVADIREPHDRDSLFTVYEHANPKDR